METLAERIARDGPVSELDAIGWAIRLAKRLEALHALGVAHGSVSPACVIAAGQDRNARAYLADVQHTTPSPAYQSPERILGGDISAADDVWALAATLYALLTGQSPYAGGSDTEIRQKILAASPPPLAVYDVGDDDLQHILDHAFARELPQRTAGITALRRALEEWHPDRGVANLPPLEDDDATNDDDDGARTMLVRDAGGYLEQAGFIGGPGVGLSPAVHPHHHQAAQAQGPQPGRPGAPMPGPGMAARMGPPAPLAAPPAPPPPAGPIPKLNEPDDDDDDDNVRTMMRSLPQDDLAGIIARASAVAAGNAAAAGALAPGAPGGFPAPGLAGGPPGRPFPVAPPPAAGAGPFGPPRPAPPPPRPPLGSGATVAAASMGASPGASFGANAGPAIGAPGAQPGFPAAFGGRPAPALPVADEDSGDEDIRTMMRTPEQMIHEEESHDAPRTVLLRDDDPWSPGAPGGGPRPAAGQPLGAPAAPGPPAPQGAPAPAWATKDPAPAPTMALPAHYEPPAPAYGGRDGGQQGEPPEPYLAGMGTQKIPPGLLAGQPTHQNLGMSLGGSPLSPQAAPPALGAPPAPPPPGADGGFRPQMPYGDVPPNGMGMSQSGAGMMAPFNPQPPAPLPEPGPASKKGLILAAVIALLIAAAATFAFLKLRGL